jgi:hypothetical protein
MSNFLKQIPIEDLMLDTQNPRLPSHLKGGGSENIISYMLLDAATLDLMLAIGQNGFFAGEPLLVVASADEKYRVIEGNRRLTALMLLKDPKLAPVKKTKVSQIVEAVPYKGCEIKDIPCQVFPSEGPIHKYLGYRHITGVQSWDLVQKAAFLSGFRKNAFPKLTVDDASRELAKMIGSRRDYVKRLLVGFEVYERIRDQGFFAIPNLSEGTFYFNYIADSLSRNNIAEFVGVDFELEDPVASLNTERLKQWTLWFFEKNDQNQPRIRATAEELKMLDAVVASDRAFRAFNSEGKSLKDAYDLTGEIDQIFVDCVTAAVSKLEMADSLAHKVDSPYHALEDDLRSIGRLVRKIRAAISDEGNGDDAK